MVYIVYIIWLQASHTHGLHGVPHPITTIAYMMYLVLVQTLPPMAYLIWVQNVLLFYILVFLSTFTSILDFACKLMYVPIHSMQPVCWEIHIILTQ